jgi:hypothetical protein
MTLDKHELKEIRCRLNHLAKTTIDCIDYFEYESDVMQPYAFKRFNQLLDEFDELKATFASLKRKDVVKDINTAFDEVGI